MISGLLLLVSQAFGVDTPVPVPLQATLLLKIAAYDRNSPGNTAPVLIVERAGDVASQRIASQLQQALEGAPKPPASVDSLEFTDADALAALAASTGTHVVYIATSLNEDETLAIGAAFAGRNVLTVSADPTSVPEGMVLAFDLVSGQTKILINLPQARLQGVDFDTALLGIAKVYK